VLHYAQVNKLEHVMEVKKNPGQVSAYLDENILAQLKAMAVAEDRSISYLVERAVRRMVIGPVQTLSNNTTAQTEGDLKRAGRQVDLEEAIASSKKRVAPAKHK
jgi:predicted transcriptional regulator